MRFIDVLAMVNAPPRYRNANRERLGIIQRKSDANAGGAIHWSIKDVEPRLYFVWLVPVMKGEASFARKNGWQKFERLIVEQDPDLLDLNRKPLNLR